jgi:DNA-binding LacI/PurR family transcriptional regulator
MTKTTRTPGIADPAKQPTISDVAALAGVSRAAASRALSASPRPVSAEKRERVLAAAAELGFRPNILAQSLTRKSVNLVAVLVNHLHDLSDLDLFDSLIARIQGSGKQVMFVRVGDVASVQDFLRDGLAYHVDAAIVFSDFADAASVRDMFRSERVIMLNGRHDAQSPAVIADEAIGIHQAISHAARQGVKTAALVTGRSSSLVEQARIGYYRAALGIEGIQLIRSFQGDYSYESGRAAAAALCGERCPDAIFCTSDAMAMGLLDVQRKDFPEGRPTRFRLYGYDDLSLLSFEAYPISSIGYDHRAFVDAIIAHLTASDSRVGGVSHIATRFTERLTG